MAYQGYKGYGSRREPGPEEQLAALELLARSQGITLEQEKPKTSVLQKIGRLLSVGESFTAGLQEYGDPIKGIQEGLTYEDIMKKRVGGRELTTAERAEAIAEGIAKDPTTYLSLGVGGGAKLATKTLGKVTLKKAGVNALRSEGAKAAKAIAEEITETATKNGITKTELDKILASRTVQEGGITRAERQFARGIEAGDKNYTRFVDEGGLKVGIPFTEGTTVVKGSSISKYTDPLIKSVRSVPVVDKAVDAVGRAFTPHYDVKKEISALRAEGNLKEAADLERGIQLMDDSLKKTGAEQRESLMKFQQWSKGHSPERRAEIANLMERLPTEQGIQTSTKEISELHKQLRETVKTGELNIDKVAKDIADESDLSKLPNMSPGRLAQLKKAGIKSVDDLAIADREQLGKALSQVVNTPKGQYVRSGADIAGRLQDRAGYAIESFTQNTYRQADLEKQLDADILEAQNAIKKAKGSVKNIGDDTLREAVIKLREANQGLLKEEQKRELVGEGLEDYLHRILTPEAQEAVRRRGGMAGLKRQMSLSLGSAAKHRTNEFTIAESEKFLKDKYGLQGDFYIKDPFVTTAIRENTSIAVRNTYDAFEQMGNSIGRKAPIETTVVRQGNKTKEVQKFGKIEDGGLTYRVPDVKYFKDRGIALPEVIAKDLEKTQQVLTNNESLNDFVRLFDKAQGLWKSSVTGLFPAFHVRNMIGASYNNYLAGITSIDPYFRANEILKQMEKVEKATEGPAREAALEGMRRMKIRDARGRVWNANEVMKEYDRRVGRGTGRRADILTDVTRELSGDKNQQILNQINWGPRALEWTEERVRLPLFLDTLKKTGEFDEAAKKVFQYHFDYSPAGMTAFESQFLRRVMPFYRWSRGNIPLQLAEMVKQPGKQAATLKVIRGLSDEDVRDDLPEYMQKGAAAQIGPTRNGEASILTGLGLPIEDVNNISSSGLLGMMSPLLRTPIEMKLDSSAFYEKPISELGPQLARNYKDFPDELGGDVLRDMLQIKEVTKADGTKTYAGNPQRLYALNSTAGRILGSIGKAGDTNEPTNLKALNFLTGVKVKSVNLENERYYRSRALLNEYQKRLQQQGVLKTYTKYYSPKGQTVAEIQ